MGGVHSGIDLCLTSACGVADDLLSGRVEHFIVLLAGVQLSIDQQGVVSHGEILRR